MYHLTFDNKVFNTAILIKESALLKARMEEHYLEPMKDAGFDTSGCIGFSLTYDKAKPSAACRKSYLSLLLPELVRLGVTTVLCCDGEYFKTLTGAKSAEPTLGNILPCSIKGFEHINVLYGFSYSGYFYNPDNKDRMKLALDALVANTAGTYTVLGANVLQNVEYPVTEADIASALERLLKYDKLTIDIEAFSLKHYSAGIGTISFSWDEHSAVVFPVDAVACEPYEIDVWDKKDKCFKKRIAHIKEVHNAPIRVLLKSFFERFTGAAIWHNASYDVYVLIYQLWMDGLLDRKGLLEGLAIMTRNVHCTQIITYLATNSCAGNNLGLKFQAHEFAGDYAVDVTDIRLQPLPDLLKYNAVDTCSTYYVWNKNYPAMVADDQESVYLDHFRKYLVDIIDMQLTGMCLDMPAVHAAEDKLKAICTETHLAMLQSSFFKVFQDQLTAKEQLAEFERRKSKAKNPQNIKIKPIEDINKPFNVNSNQQLQHLLYDFMGLPVIDRTKTKQPATGADTLEKLINHTKNPEYAAMIQAIIDYLKADKIITTFIRAFKEAPLAEDGYHYLYGSYKLGGTVSGRLSSSTPNMQTIPSGSYFAKIIKSCFVAPAGWLFGGADFASLEDRISALTTKDPEKLKIYCQGFDGHSYRAYHYWPHLFPNIDPTSVDDINSITSTHKDVRNKSKAPTFLCTYGGTYLGLMQNCGFSESEALTIEQNYHKLYTVSDQWVASKIKQASTDGYVTAAFGLRVRTPLLRQVVLGNARTPFEAQAEARTAGNSLGQSWCLLNSRACSAFMLIVRASKYALDIKVCAQIHDSIYLYWKDDWELTQWVNDTLNTCMEWQDHPDIQHDVVKLYGELAICFPTWNDSFDLPLHGNIAAIKEAVIGEVNVRNTTV